MKKQRFNRLFKLSNYLNQFYMMGDLRRPWNTKVDPTRGDILALGCLSFQVGFFYWGHHKNVVEEYGWGWVGLIRYVPGRIRYG